MKNSNLPFRSLDNSTSTQMGYNLEAAHWSRALKSAQASAGSGLSSLGVVGLFLSIFISLFLIILTLIAMLVEWILKPSQEPINTKSTHTPKYFKETNDDLKNVWD